MFWSIIVHFCAEITEFLGLDARPYTFSYAELKAGTDDFSPINKLGEGGFGPVYKVSHICSNNRNWTGETVHIIKKTNEHIRNLCCKTAAVTSMVWIWGLHVLFSRLKIQIVIITFSLLEKEYPFKLVDNIQIVFTINWNWFLFAELNLFYPSKTSSYLNRDFIVNILLSLLLNCLILIRCII